MDFINDGTVQIWIGSSELRPGYIAVKITNQTNEPPVEFYLSPEGAEAMALTLRDTLEQPSPDELPCRLRALLDDVRSNGTPRSRETVESLLEREGMG